MATTSRTTDTSAVTYTLPDSVDDLVLTGIDHIDGTGNALDNMITGNVGNNSLLGLDGNDTLQGGDGDDGLLGGNGDDVLSGEAGNDTLEGELGDDTLSGGIGDDKLIGGDGSDTLYGDKGNDLLDGGLQGDTLLGGAGDDVYVVDDGRDVVIELADNAASITIVSRDSLDGESNGVSVEPSFSADGTQIVFTSLASNLIDKDSNDSSDIFIKDLTSGGVTLVSQRADGVQGNSASSEAAFSADGTKVVFTSNASNLVDADTNDASDIFVKDLKDNSIIRISTNQDGTDAFGSSSGASFSADGTKVLFQSAADNLLDGDTNRVTDIFIKDILTGEVIRINVSKDGEQADAASFNAKFSADSSKVIFESDASNLVAGDTNGQRDIFVVDLVTKEILRVSEAADGTATNGASSYGSFSADGKRVVFESDASNLLDKDNNDSRDIFIKDLDTGEVIAVSDIINGNGASHDARFSPDDQRVIFSSEATTLVAEDFNNASDIFVKDLTSGQIVAVSVDANGNAANGKNYSPVFSADGQQIAFVTDAANLVNVDNNDVSDIVVATLGAGGGIDTVNSSVSYTLGNNVENLNLLGNDSLSGGGNDLDNVISGSGGGDFLSGYGGNDTILGMDGNDNVDGGSGDDRLEGGKGNDTLLGSDGKNTYVYTEGNDRIYNQEDYLSDNEDFGIGDTLLLSTLNRNQVTFGQDIQNSSTLLISVNNSTDTVRVDGFFTVDAPLALTYDTVEKITFADGTSLTANEVLAIVTNTAPVLNSDPLFATVDEDNAITIDLIANTYDEDGNTVSLVSAALIDESQGTLEVSGGKVVFTPAANFNGDVQLTYTVTDGIAETVGQATITVQPVNDAPESFVALGDEGTLENSPFTFTLPDSAFIDVDDDNLSYFATLEDGSSLPAWMSFNDKSLTFSGTPSFDDAGVYRIKVTVIDGGGLTATQSFTFDVTDVNRNPQLLTATPSFTTNEDTAIILDVLANVIDLDNDVLTIDSNSLTVSSGVVVLNDDQTLTYTPNPDFNGDVTLTYVVQDGNGGSLSLSNTIIVQPVNDAPVAGSISASLSNGVEDTPYTVSAAQLLQSFTDIEGDSLSIKNLSSSNGSITDNLDGTFTITPTANFNGNVSLSYEVSDGQLSTATSLSYTVDAVNDAPIAGSISASLSNGVEDTAYTVSATQLLQGFTDIEGDSLSVTNLSSSNGSITDNLDGTFTITPTANFNGVVTLNYEVSDGQLSTATSLNYTVDAVNDAPIAGSISASLSNGVEDTAYTISAAQLLQGFTDIEGDSLSVKNRSSSNGSITDNLDGTFTITPTANFNGSVTLNYEVSDGQLSTAASLNYSIDAVNDVPEALVPVSDQQAKEKQTFSYTLPDDAFIDKDLDALTYSASLEGGAGLPSWLSFDAASKTFSGTPDYQDAGTLRVTVVASDAQASISQTFSLDIENTNQAPELVSTQAILAAGQENVDYVIQKNDLIQGFTDGDGDALIIGTIGANHGTIIDNGSTLTLKPEADFSGQVTLTYTVEDGQGGTISATQSIVLQTATVTNHAPVAGSISATLSNGVEDTAYTISAAQLLQGFTDIEGDSLSVKNLSSSNGNITDNLDGTFTITPTPNFNGSVTLSYDVSDGQLTTAASLNYTIDAVNDAPIAGSISASLSNGLEDTAYTISAAQLLQGFTDIEGDSLSVKNLSSSNGSITDNLDGTFTITPTPNFNGSVTLSYDVSDGQLSTAATLNYIVDAVNDTPIAGSISASLSNGVEDTAYTVSAAQLLQGFTDIEGDSLSVKNLSSSNGSITDNQDGTFTLTPTPNFNGSVILSYEVSDGQLSTAATLSYTVDAVNDAPIAGSISASLSNGVEDTSYTVSATQLLQGFTDIEGDSLSVTNLSSSNGSITDNLDGTFTITPTANFNGNVTLNYEVSDGQLSTAANLSYMVDAVNDAPIAGSISASLSNGVEDTPYTVSAAQLLQGFTDIEGDSLSVTNLSSSNGSITDNLDGTFTITPNANFNGSVTLNYEVSDGQLSTATSLNYTVDAVNDAPIAGSISATLSNGVEDATYTVSASQLLQGFTDVEGDSLSVKNLSSSNGSITDNLDGTFTITPTANFNGNVSLTYEVSDGQLSTAASLSYIVDAVNDAPIAGSISASLSNGVEDTPYTVSAAQLLQGFTDIEGDSLSVKNLSSSNGSITDNLDGTFTITPTANFNGSVTLNYDVSDGQLSAAASLSYTVDAVNDAPEVLVPVADQQVDESHIFTYTLPTDAFIDIDTAVLSYSATLASGADLPSWLSFDAATQTFSGTPSYDDAGALLVIVTANDGVFSSSQSFALDITNVNRAPVLASTPPALTLLEDSGSLVIDVLSRVSDLDGDALIVSNVQVNASEGSAVLNADQSITFTPNANFNGTVSLSYEVSDGQGGLLPMTETITVTPVNDAPIAGSIGASLSNGLEDTPYTVSASQLLQGFTDIEGDSLSVTNLSSSNGSITDNLDGTFTITPTANFNGSVSLNYEVSDGQLSTAATLSYMVDAVNDAPIAGSIGASLSNGLEDTPYTVSASQLLQGFTDIEGDSLSVTNLSSSNGSITDNLDGTFTITPTANFNGSVSLNYEVSDGQLSTAATLSYMVDAVNDAPIAGSISASLSNGTEDTAYTVSVSQLLQGFTDIENDSLSVKNLSSSNGSITDNLDGTFTITPMANFNGAVTLNYEVSDGQLSTAATLSYMVDAVNDAPIAGSISASLSNGVEDTAYTISAAQLLQGFTDIEGDSLSVTNLSSSNGSITDNLDGTFTITPTANFNGSVSLNYEVSDGQLSTAATLSYMVDAVNDAPEVLVPVADQQVDESQIFTYTLPTDAFIDIDTAVLSYSATLASGADLPSWLSFDAATQTFSGTPSYDDAGTLLVIVTANDGVFSSSQSFALDITNVNRAPVLASTPPALTLLEDSGSLVIDVLSRVSDLDGDALIVSNVQVNASEGSAVLNADQSITFTPNANFNGTVSLSYEVSDGQGGLLPVTATITVTPVNDAPIAGSIGASLSNGTEDTAYTVSATQLLQGFTDIEGDSLSVTNLSSSNGSITDNLDGTFTITPTANFNGNFSLTYDVSDGQLSTAATLNYTIDAVNDAPVAGSISASLSNGVEDTTYTVSATQLLQGFTDIEGDSLSVKNLSSSNGSITDNLDGTFTITPTPNFNGVVTLNYDVSDGQLSTAATLNYTIDAVNDAPVAGSISASLSSGVEDTAYTISAAQLLQGFTDVEGDSLSVKNLSSSNSSITDNLDGTFTITPMANFNGSVSLTYDVSDGQLTTAASLNYTVDAMNDAPIAGSISASLSNGVEDTAYTVSAAQLLHGFTDIEGDSLSVKNLSSSNGSITDNLDGTFTITPTANFNGNVSLNYDVSDGQLSTAASLNYSVNAVNDAPEALVPVSDQQAKEKQTFSYTLPDDAFIDKDLDGLTYSASLEGGAGLPSWLSFDAASKTFSGTLDYQDAGTLRVTVVASDAQASISQTFSLDIENTNQAPELVSTQAILAAGQENVDYVIQKNDLIQGFTDGDGDALIIGTISANHGTIIDNGSTLTLKPEADFSGQVTLTYTVEDGQGGAISATQSIVLQAATVTNHAPVAGSISASLSNGVEDTTYTVSASQLLQGFTDIEGDSLSITNLSSSNGSITDNLDGTFTITPTANFNGNVSLTYEVSDGQLSTAASLSYIVDAVNDAPIAGSISASLSNGVEDTPYTVSAAQLLQGFTDIEGDSLSVKNLSSSNGSTTDNLDGTFTLTPTPNFNGSVTLTYEVSDGQLTTAASLSYTVDAVNDAPVAGSISASLSNGVEDTAYIISAAQLLQGFTDIEGDSLSIKNLSSSNGSITDNLDGTFTITPTANFNGSVSLTYEVSDGQLSTAASLSYTVDAVNDAPVAGSISASLSNGVEDTAYTVSAAQLLQGFTDVDGDSLSVKNLSSSNGSITDNLDGTFTITPTANFNGNVTLNYNVSDSQLTTAASLSYTVDAVNDAPESSFPLLDQKVDEGQLFTYALPSDAFIDIDSASLTYSATLAGGQALPSWLSFDAATQTFSGTPSFDDAGTLLLTVTASDGVLIASQSFALDITNVNRAPQPITSQPAFQAVEDTTIVLDVLAQVVDADGDVLTIDPNSLSVTSGSVVLNANQTVTFTPAANVNGDVHLSYTVSDGNAVVTINKEIVIQAVNDAPVIKVTKTSTTRIVEDAAAVLIGLAFGLQVSDVDGGTLSSLRIAIQRFTVGDVLAVNTDGTSLQAAYNANTGVLTVNGSDTIAHYQQVIDSLLLSTQAESGTDTRALRITVGDGVLFSNVTTPSVPVDYVVNEEHIGTDGNDTLSGAEGDDLLNGNAGNDILTGGNGNDTLVGGAGDDILDGGDGADDMFGDAGNDIFIVDSEGDTVHDTGGDADQVQSTISFVLPEGFEILTFTGLETGLIGQGNTGNNVLGANNAGSELQGHDGDDTLTDGNGRDVFTGGSGADTFDFSHLQNNIARLGEVLDFSTARGDKIDISKIDANNTVAGNQDFHFIGSGDFTGNAGELRFGQRLLQGDINGDGKADFEIKLVGVLELNHDDILGLT